MTPAFHEAAWLALAGSSLLLGLGYLMIALRARVKQRTAIGVAAVCLLLLVAEYTLAMTALSLRRDFVRPYHLVPATSIAFVGWVAMLVLYAYDQPRGRGGGKTEPRATPENEDG
jgi:hypothetical protein